MTRPSLRILVCTLIAVTALTATAQPSLYEEIIVTSTRVEKDQLKVPLAIGTVGQTDVQRKQQLGIDESLNKIPGIFFQNRYNFSQDLRVAIRGFGARANFGIRGIKIFVDGIPSTVADGQGGVDDIDIGSTQRIEVIRGPSSSLYGSASGGVISLYTQDPPETPFIETRLSVGEFDFQKYQLKTGGQFGKLGYMISASHLTLDGFRHHSEVENSLINSKFDYSFDDSTHLTAIINAFDSPKAQDPGALPAAQVEVDRQQAFCGLSGFNDACRFDAGEEIDQQKFGLIFRKSLGPLHEIQLRNYYVWRGFGNRLPFANSGIVQFDRFFLGGGAQYTYSGDLLGHRNRFTVGVDVESQEDDRRRFDNDLGRPGAPTLNQTEMADSIGVFFQNEFALTDSVEVTFGGRYDMVDLEVDDHFLGNGDDSGKLDFNEFNPRVGILWTVIPAVNVYANYSTSFETPTFTELANPAALGTAGGFNPSLTAQTADSYELGVKGVINKRLRYEVAAFRIEADDEITNVVNVGGRSFFQNANTTRNGIEAAAGFELMPGLDASLAYTYSDFDFDEFSVDPSSNGNELPGVPENQFHAELSYSHPAGWYLTWDYLHVGTFFANNANTVENNDYQVSNLHLGRDFELGRWSVQPYFGANNLFDEDYNSNVRLNAFGARYFEPAPGINVYGGVTIRLDFVGR